MIVVLMDLQKLKSAEQFYEGKVKELSDSLKDLETIVQRKQTNARTIEEGMYVCMIVPVILLLKIGATSSKAEDHGWPGWPGCPGVAGESRVTKGTAHRMGVMIDEPDIPARFHILVRHRSAVLYWPSLLPNHCLVAPIQVIFR